MRSITFSLNIAGRLRYQLLRLQAHQCSYFVENKFDFFSVTTPTPRILHCQLNRPAKLNAMTLESWRQVQCHKPVISAIHGACVGGAVDLVAATDIRFCSSDAWFQVKETELGFTADIGTLQLLPAAIGSDSLARELILTGRRFYAEEAFRVGFVSRVLDSPEATLAAALSTAKKVAENSPVAVQTAKANLLYSRNRSFEEGLRHIADLNQVMLQSPDIKLAVAAALQKNKPEFPDA
ncbi:unnamed protein product [Schistocephalus solidus]|uniref:Delta(3,5)-Delta(2,4)-dienoyl-CoA isomerase, mitochondrial n=1 Tax=Schistocephalus solidus TaxID=70667 RepID=A0A183SWL9_SCHSO|nr:unnamed protein product [Schistocephalus solidus]